MYIMTICTYLYSKCNCGAFDFMGSSFIATCSLLYRFWERKIMFMHCFKNVKIYQTTQQMLRNDINAINLNVRDNIVRLALPFPVSTRQSYHTQSSCPP